MKKFLGCTLMVFAMLSVSGCVTNTPVSGKDCYGFKVIRPTAKDIRVISDQLAAGVLAHDLHGKDICGWKP